MVEYVRWIVHASRQSRKEMSRRIQNWTRTNEFASRSLFLELKFEKASSESTNGKEYNDIMQLRFIIDHGYAYTHIYIYIY